MIVVAYLIIALVLPLPYSDPAQALILSEKERGSVVAAPALWSFEVVSALRRAVGLELLMPDELQTALQSICSFRIEDVPPTRELHQRSLAWSERLQTSKAYDSAYLAASELLGAEFWTSDRKLAQAAKQCGVSWVHCIDEWIG